MRAALSVVPGRPGSLKLSQREEAPPTEGLLAVRTLAVGLSGIDRDIVAGVQGALPPGKNELIIGREAVGVVAFAPTGLGFAVGDLVAAIPRRPDPVPCPNCAAGEWDMCTSGLYTERGVLGRDGFAAERFRIEPAFAVKLPPRLGFLGALLEPAALASKAWEHCERLGRRAAWAPRRVLVIGAGTTGLLATLIAKQRGLEVHVYERVKSGRKPALVDALGVAYHCAEDAALAEAARAADIILECAGDSELLWRALEVAAPDAVGCIVGGRLFTAAQRAFSAQNRVVFGAHGANRRHYDGALQVLAAADRGWLERMITKKVVAQDYAQAFEADDVKTVLLFGDL